MKTLLLLRHGKSSWSDAGLADHERPLKKRGKRDSLRMGQWIKQRGLMPDLIVSSTARRAHDTATRFVEAAEYQSDFVLDGRIYHAEADQLVSVIAQFPEPAQRVMIVGHNPGLEDLLDVLTGAGEAMPTASLAHVELNVERWDQVNASRIGRLVDLWRPRDLESQ